MSLNSFPKREHLKSRKQIQMLFQSGKAFSLFPFRVIYQIIPDAEPTPVQVGFSVPSRLFKRAVDRNRIKRQMREAYRLQKSELLSQLNFQQIHLVLFFIYTGKKLPNSTFLHRKMAKSLNKLSQSLFEKDRRNEKNK